MTADAITSILPLIVRIAKIPLPAPTQISTRAGLASVDALELLVELEEAFGITIPDDRFVGARTAVDLAALVNELSAASSA